MKHCMALMLAGLLALMGIGAASAESIDAADYGYRGDETVEEQLVYDAEGVRITATGLEIVHYVPVLGLRIENTSDKTLEFDLEESVLNDWMWDANLCLYENKGSDPDDDYYDETADIVVADGETLACGLGFSNEYYYRLCGITGFGGIGFVLRAFDPENGETAFITPVINVATSLGTDYPGLYVDAGTLAYDEGGVRIVIPGLNLDEYGGPGVLVYANNFSDRPVLITAKRCTVNGAAAEPWFSAVVSPGRQCLAEIGFEDDVTRIDTLSIAFRVAAYNAEDMENPDVIGTSDVVELTF